MRASSHHRPFPDESAHQRVRLLLKEHGSSPLTHGGSEDFDETLVIVQMRGELPAAFAQRAIERIEGLERSGRRFDAARVMTGTDYDPAAQAARRLVTLTVASHAKSRGGMSELVFDADAKGDVRVHAELLELVGELLATPHSDKMPIRVCFAQSLQ